MMVTHLQLFLKFPNLTMPFYRISNYDGVREKKNVGGLFACTVWIRNYIFYIPLFYENYKRMKRNNYCFVINNYKIL